MEAGSAAGAVDHGCLQVVEDDGAGTATEEVESIDDRAVKLGLALRERELDEHQPAIAEHGYEDRDLACRSADLHSAALSPVNLHGLGRLVVDFFVGRGSTRRAGPVSAPRRPLRARLWNR